MAETTEKITLHCVQERGKLRIRFHSFTNANGKTYTNVYNNSYNCQFPRDIREAGRFYEIGKDDLMIVNGGKQPFYRVRKNGIRIVERGAQVNTTKSSSSTVSPVAVNEIERPEQVFEVNECVICMEGKPDTIFIPCAHLCSCMECYKGLKKSGRALCPLCRRTVTDVLANDA